MLKMAAIASPDQDEQRPEKAAGQQESRRPVQIERPFCPNGLGGMKVQRAAAELSVWFKYRRIPQQSSASTVFRPDVFVCGAPRDTLRVPRGPLHPTSSLLSHPSHPQRPNPPTHCTCQQSCSDVGERVFRRAAWLAVDVCSPQHCGGFVGYSAHWVPLRVPPSGCMGSA